MAGSSLSIKYASLGFLSVQTASHVLLTRFSRQAKEPYLASTVVAVVELCKLFICCIMLLIEQGLDIRRMVWSLNRDILQKPADTLKLAVPAGLYVVQNNLLFVALTNLDSATYQVTYQLKILTTALFSVLLLRKKLLLNQWISLLLLTAGVALVQIARDEGSSKQTSNSSPFIGLVAVICAAVTSGFSGVYFEKVLKGSNQSLWIRNIQLAVFGVLIGFVSVFVNDRDNIYERGFFQGYTVITWGVIALGVISGLTVALVVKYADNILKGFAVSISILMSTFVSFYFLHDFEPNWLFAFGSLLVITATFIYGLDLQTKKTR